MSMKYALTDDDARRFLADEYLRASWLTMMNEVATQLEKGVKLPILCGIDAPRATGTCVLMERVSAETDQDVTAVCTRIKDACVQGNLTKTKSTPEPSRAAAASEVLMQQDEEEKKSD